MLWVVSGIYLWLFLSIGRLFALQACGTHSTPRPSLFNPAVCLTSGAALWAVWWLALVPLAGAGTWITLGVFGLFAMAFSGIMYRTWQGRKGTEHFVSTIAISVLLLLPLLLAVPQAMPAYVADYGFLSHLTQLANVGGWPSATQAAALNITSLESPPGWVALLMPLAQAGLPVPALSPLLGFAAVVMAALTLTVNVGISIKWSNLLLATCAGLLVVTLTLPLPWPIVLEQQSPVLWMALALLVAALPLFASLPLPTGLSALPAGLALMLAATLHPQGLLMALWVAALWIGRLAVEGRWHRNMPGLPAVVAAHVLVLLPLLGWGLALLVWQKAGGEVRPFPAMLWQDWGRLPAVPDAPAWWQLMQWIGIFAALVYGAWPWLRMNVCGGLRGVMTTHAWRSMALPLAGGVLLIGLLTGSLPAWLPTLGWLVLVTLWRRGLLWYQTTVWQRRSFAMPWRMGALMALVLMITAQLYPKPEPTLVQQAVVQLRALRLGDAQTAPLLPQGEPVALWIENDSQQSLLPIAGYALTPHVPVLGLQGQAATLGELHRASRAAGAKHIVVVAPSENQTKLLRLPKDVFVALFVTTPQNVLLEALFSSSGGRVSVGQ